MSDAKSAQHRLSIPREYPSRVSLESIPRERSQALKASFPAPLTSAWLSPPGPVPFPGPSGMWPLRASFPLRQAPFLRRLETLSWPQISAVGQAKTARSRCHRSQETSRGASRRPSCPPVQDLEQFPYIPDSSVGRAAELCEESRQRRAFRRTHTPSTKVTLSRLACTIPRSCRKDGDADSSFMAYRRLLRKESHLIDPHHTSFTIHTFPTWVKRDSAFKMSDSDSEDDMPLSMAVGKKSEISAHPALCVNQPCSRQSIRRQRVTRARPPSRGRTRTLASRSRGLG